MLGSLMQEAMKESFLNTLPQAELIGSTTIEPKPFWSHVMSLLMMKLEIRKWKSILGSKMKSTPPRLKELKNPQFRTLFQALLKRPQAMLAQVR